MILCIKSRLKQYCVIQIKVLEHYFTVPCTVLLLKVFLTLKFVDKTLNCVCPFKCISCANVYQGTEKSTKRVPCILQAINEILVCVCVCCHSYENYVYLEGILITSR